MSRFSVELMDYVCPGKCVYLFGLYSGTNKGGQAAFLRLMQMFFSELKPLAANNKSYLVIIVCTYFMY